MKNDESSLRSALAGLSSAGTEKFKTAKALVSLSESQPEALEPVFEEIAALLSSGNNIIKWSAYQIMANLAAVAPDDRVEGILDRYLAPIPGPAMITAGHAIRGSARMAASHRHLANRIVQAILQVEQGRYKSEECRNIAIGHAITALGSMESSVRRLEHVIAFVRRQTWNTRPGTRKKAELFLKKNQQEPSRKSQRRSLKVEG